MKDLDKIERDVSKLQEEVDLLNGSIKLESEAITELESQLQIKNEAIITRKKLIQERLRGLLFYSVPERLKFLLTIEDLEMFNRGEVIMLKMLKNDVAEYRFLTHEMENLNDLRVVVHEEKFKLEENKKTLSVSLNKLKLGLDKKKEILAKAMNTERGYVALVKRFEKGAKKIGRFVSARGKAKTIGVLKKLLPPIKGKIIKGFGKRWDSKIKNWIYSKGIIIQADYGKEIYSISDGVVRFSGWILGYGKVVILGHKDNLFSVYAHLARQLLQVGDKVDKGAVIAYVGDSGSVDRSSLYFELRTSRKSIDPTPLFY